MPIKTRRWDEPPDPDGEGHRILVTRYRPRGVARSAETWDQWLPALGPSKALHKAVYTTGASPISWPIYCKLYLREQSANVELIKQLATRVAAGETVTLLCSSACVREARCHRSLLKGLIEAAVSEKLLNAANPLV